MPASRPPLRLVAELASLDTATQYVRESAVSAQIHPDLLNHIDLIVEELFVNVAMHAYPPQTQGIVELHCDTPHPGLLGFTIADQGIAYNPLLAAAPNLDAGLDDRPIGGLGVFLVRQWSESIDYQRTDGWNRLHLTLSASSLSATA